MVDPVQCQRTDIASQAFLPASDSSAHKTLELGADLGVAVETLLANVRRDGIMFRNPASGPAAKCAAVTSSTSSALCCSMRTGVPRASVRTQRWPRRGESKVWSELLEPVGATRYIREAEGLFVASASGGGRWRVSR
jgi:hypothetical protein